MAKLFVATFLIASIFAQCPGDKYCTNCNDKKCDVCVNSYVNLAGLCVAADKSVKNCYTFNSATTCAECNEGYYLTAAATCAKNTIDNCLFINPLKPAMCLVCNNGNVPTASGLCTGTTACNITNCVNCADANTCAVCKAGYSLNESFKCVTPPYKNCLQSNGALCVECERGYYDDNVKCVSTTVQGSVARLAIALIAGVFALVF